MDFSKDNSWIFKQFIETLIMDFLKNFSRISCGFFNEPFVDFYGFFQVLFVDF